MDRNFSSGRGSMRNRTKAQATQPMRKYAATAAAAALGGAGVADAAIISATGLNLGVNSSTTPVNLDFKDGGLTGTTVATFEFRWNSTYTGKTFLLTNSSATGGPKSVVTTTPLGMWPTAFSVDSAIDGSRVWSSRTSSTDWFALSGQDAFGAHNGYSVAPQGFFSGTTAYLGVRFTSGAGTHYGWISYTANAFNASPHVGTINGWGYESTAGASIKAGEVAVAPVPEPSALAILAGGALVGTASVAAKRWRKRQAVA